MPHHTQGKTAIGAVWLTVLRSLTDVAVQMPQQCRDRSTRSQICYFPTSRMQRHSRLPKELNATKLLVYSHLQALYDQRGSYDKKGKHTRNAANCKPSIVLSRTTSSHHLVLSHQRNTFPTSRRKARIPKRHKNTDKKVYSIGLFHVLFQFRLTPIVADGPKYGKSLTRLLQSTPLANQNQMFS